MKQADYITGKVGEFVTWMSERLDGDTFKHAYISRRTMTRWACENLFDAYVSRGGAMEPMRGRHKGAT